MKIVKFVLIGIALLLVVLFAGSALLRAHWGRDEDRAQVTTAQHSFEAHRNEVGVWRVSAKTHADSYFATGWLQAWDREFQMQTLRAASRGELGSLFGDSMLATDRLFRNILRAAEWELADLTKRDPEVVALLQAFVDGVNHAIEAEARDAPIEYKIFSFNREMFKKWEPIDVLSIARLQGWILSSDLRDDLLRSRLLEDLGPLRKALFAASEIGQQAPPYAMYSQVKPRPNSRTERQRAIDPLWDFLDFDGKRSSARRGLLPTKQVHDVFPAAIFGASNSWIIAEPLVGLEPTLCNDTHLETRWPSVLYPIEIRIEDSPNQPQPKSLTQGFAFPGTPTVVIGALSRLQTQGHREEIAWSITSANFVDSQDLVSLPKSEKTKAREEVFVIRDVTSGSQREERISEKWSAFGPVVDSYLDFRETKTPSDMVALDWIGFRKSVSPLRYFVRQEIDGISRSLSLVESEWDFPNVSFGYLYKSAPGSVEAGHLMTGLAFDRSPSDRLNNSTIISSAQAARRRLSRARDRPKWSQAYNGDASIFLASGNQRVFADSLQDRIAFHGSEGSRTERILERRDAILLKPESAQFDEHSKQMLSFVRGARALLNADRACFGRSASEFTECTLMISQLDSWDGMMGAKQWEPLLVALWRSLTLDALYRSAVQDGRREVDADGIIKEWVMSPMSERFLRSVLKDEKFRTALEKEIGIVTEKVLATTFQQALKLLDQKMGPQYHLRSWGLAHRLEFRHPVALIPGDLGPMMRDALFGLPISVGGGVDSPNARPFSWDPKNPLRFSSSHAAVMRMCVRVPREGSLNFRWSNLTGVSGNPFSKHAWSFSREYHFKDRLFDQVTY